MVFVAERNMPSRTHLLQLLCSCLAVVVCVAEPQLSKERVVMTTKYGDIQIGFFPEVRATIKVLQ